MSKRKKKWCGYTLSQLQQQRKITSLKIKGEKDRLGDRFKNDFGHDDGSDDFTDALSNMLSIAQYSVKTYKSFHDLCVFIFGLFAKFFNNHHNIPK